MKEIVIHKKYYAVTLGATQDASGKLQPYRAVQSEWVNYSDVKTKREKRRARIVNPMRIAELWQSLGMPYEVVNSEDDLLNFLLNGGSALVELSIAEKHLPEVLRSNEVSPSGLMGFLSTKNLPNNVLKRKATRHKRKWIKKRDEFRCKICGKKLDAHNSVRLTVHHIRKTSHGGLTEDINLITVCEDCHKDIHKQEYDDISLFFLVDPDKQPLNVERKRNELLEDIKNYKKWIRELSHNKKE